MQQIFYKLLIVTLSSSGVIAIWFFSPLKCSLAKLFFKTKTYDSDLFDSMLSMKFEKLGFLSGCHYCMFFWSSLFFSFLVSSSFSEILICVFSSNFLHHVMNKYIHGR